MLFLLSLQSSPLEASVLKVCMVFVVTYVTVCMQNLVEQVLTYRHALYSFACT